MTPSGGIGGSAERAQACFRFPAGNGIERYWLTLDFAIAGKTLLDDRTLRLTPLLHSLVNTAIVVGALVIAGFCRLDKHPIRTSFLLLIAGVCCYAVDIYAGVQNGLCTPSVQAGFLKFINELDECGNPYGIYLAIAQVTILGAVLTWLYLAWGAVLRRYQREREDSNHEA